MGTFGRHWATEAGLKQTVTVGKKTTLSMNSFFVLLHFLTLEVIFGHFLAVLGPLHGPKSSKGPHMDFDTQMYYFIVTLGKK